MRQIQDEAQSAGLKDSDCLCHESANCRLLDARRRHLPTGQAPASNRQCRGQTSAPRARAPEQCSFRNQDSHTNRGYPHDLFDSAVFVVVCSGTINSGLLVMAPHKFLASSSPSSLHCSYCATSSKYLPYAAAACASCRGLGCTFLTKISRAGPLSFVVMWEGSTSIQRSRTRKILSLRERGPMPGHPHRIAARRRL
jgi:hypothetical protein